MNARESWRSIGYIPVDGATNRKTNSLLIAVERYPTKASFVIPKTFEVFWCIIVNSSIKTNVLD